MNEKAFQKFLATGEYVPTEDAAPKKTTLEAHDRRFHPNGFNPKTGRCLFREAMAKGDASDDLLKSAEAEEFGDKVVDLKDENVSEETRDKFVAYARKMYEWDKDNGFRPHQADDNPPPEPDFGDNLFVSRGNKENEWGLYRKLEPKWPYYNKWQTLILWRPIFQRKKPSR